MGVSMFRKTAGDAFPSPWPPPAGPSDSLLHREEAGRMALLAHLSLLHRRAGSRWLMLAAEMAGLATGSRPLSAATDWSAMPRIATRAFGSDVGSVHSARSFTSATLRRWGTAERGQDVVIPARSGRYPAAASGPTRPAPVRALRAMRGRRPEPGGSGARGPRFPR